MISRGDALAKPSTWTLADVLSSFRFWAFVWAVVLAACAMRGAILMLPVIASQTAASYAQMSMLSIGTSAGWVVGSIMAILIMPRWPRLALGLPIAGVALSNAAVLVMPDAWVVSPYLMLQGLCIGAFTVLSVVIMASLLVSGRMSKTDFIHAFALPVLFVGILPEFAAVAASMAAESESPLQVVAFTLSGCTFAALILLCLARPLSFEDQAPERHVPIPYRQRSPVKIALIGFIPALLVLAYYGFSLADAMPGGWMQGPSGIALYAAAGLIGLSAALYLFYWLYRVHGETAYLARSPRLLTPFAAVAISVLVPLGFLLVLITLGRVLRDRHRSLPTGLAFPLRWFAFWSVMAPPIAMAIIQRGVNRLNAAENSEESVEEEA